MEEGIHGLMLAPYNHPAIQQKIDELVEQQIPVVTVNTDINGSRRMAYVGSDYFRGGCTAAGLFHLMTSGNIELGIITGSSNVLCHSERIRGLRHTLETSYPRIQITEILENHDDEFESYALTRELLDKNSKIDALFFAAAGVHGGCKAVLESGRHPKIITFDEVPTTVEMLKQGVISATISQQPYRQGSQSYNRRIQCSAGTTYRTADERTEEPQVDTENRRFRNSHKTGHGGRNCHGFGLLIFGFQGNGQCCCALSDVCCRCQRKPVSLTVKSQLRHINDRIHMMNTCYYRCRVKTTHKLP